MSAFKNRQRVVCPKCKVESEIKRTGLTAVTLEGQGTAKDTAEPLTGPQNKET